MVEHLALGGVVFLRYGIGHGIRPHEQRVPVVRAEGQKERGGRTVREEGKMGLRVPFLTFPSQLLIVG